MLSIDLIEQLARMNRMKIPEPMIHAKGAGARGIFIPYMSMADYTKAAFLDNPDKETPIFVRFSRMMGRPGSPDTERDVRGFSVRFQTEDGPYDLIGSHIPVSFIRDPEKYPALIDALCPDPKTNIKDPSRLWNFVAQNPESMQMVTWLYSDRGTLRTYRTMEGHSVHTYLWETKQGERQFVRYRLRPFLEGKEMDRQEAEFLAGFDPDVAARDLAQTLENGGTVQYELSVQLVPTAQRIEEESAILDPVCIWPETLVPSIRVGKLILTQGVDNYREEVEKACFSPANLVPGIALSQEPLLLAMTFLYGDDQRSRFGSEDQVKRLYGEGQFASSANHPLAPYGEHDQLAWRLKSLSPSEQERLIDNMAEELLFVEDAIQNKIVGFLGAADREMGASLEKWLGL